MTNSRDYRIRAVCYGTDGQVTAGNPTRKMLECLDELVALLRALPVEVAAWKMDDLQETMYWKAHEKIATGPSCGHCSWKPYIIQRELMNVDDGDIVWYIDADRRWYPNVDVLAQFVDLAKETGFALLRYPAGTFSCEQYIQRATFILMGMDEPKYWKSMQFYGGIQAFERNNRTLQFVQDWLLASLSHDIIAKRKSKHEEFEAFRAHRRDQAILSILAVHYGIEPCRADGLFFQKPCRGDPPGYEG